VTKQEEKLNALQTFDVREQGAIGDGRSKDTLAIQQVIDRAGESGGGVVYLPAGNYLSGTLHLRSGVTLELSEGATLIASRDESDFDSYEKLDYESYADHETTYFRHALICGEDLQNICIRGRGLIDGQGDKRGGPKPIALKRCQQISITDVTIKNAPNYNLSLLGCAHAEIQGVTILNGFVDGIDLDCCRHVSITNCRIDSRNDAICLKTSLSLGTRSSTQHISISDCVMTTTRNAFKLGSESAGDFKNIILTNCVVLHRAEIFEARPEAGISLQAVDGGSIEHVVISNVALAGVCVPIFIRLGNRGRGQLPPPLAGQISHVSISQVVATGAELAALIAGIPDQYVRRVSLKDIRVSLLGGGRSADAQREPDEAIDSYPRASMFGVLPAYGLFIRHAAELSLNEIELRLECEDERPALVIDDAENISLLHFDAEPTTGEEPIIRLKEVRGMLTENE
jgi:Endopolygalacturonase